MKKLTFVISSFFLVCVSLYADKRISFTVTPDFGVVNGQINEFVYYVPNPEGVSSKDAEIRKLSELNWEAAWIPYMGASLNLELDTGIYVDFGFDAGIPKSSGAMVDRDWTNCVCFPDKNWLTHYSKHENSELSYYNLDFAMGQIFSFSKGFSVMPELFVTNNCMSFCAACGEGKYGENHGLRNLRDDVLVGKSEEGEMVSWKTKVISYMQNRIFIGLGVKADKVFDFGLSLNVFGKVRFAYVETEDHHFNTYRVYVDQPYGFGGFLAGGTISYSFNEKHKISLKGSYDWLPLVLGPDYYRNENAEFWSTDSQYLGGASSSLMTLSLSYTYSF